MTSRLLVTPTRVVAGAGLVQRIEPGIKLLLRSWVNLSRRLTGGRAVGLACTVAAHLLGKDGTVTFDLAGGGQFNVGVQDRYWLLPLLLDRSYEPDLDHFLARAFRRQDVFLDCGANLGLWSIAMARIALDPARVVSVEASTTTFEQLRRNWLLNAKQFTIRHEAISEKGNQELRFYADPADHASSTLVQGLSPIHAAVETVTSITLLDLLAARPGGRPSDSVTFVKLDIEGMEQAVLATISSQSQSDLIVLYEDHGRDRAHQATMLALERGFVVAYLGLDGTMERIDAQRPERLAALTPDTHRGYNFVAWGPQGEAATRMRSCFQLP